MFDLAKMYVGNVRVPDGTEYVVYNDGGGNYAVVASAWDEALDAVSDEARYTTSGAPAPWRAPRPYSSYDEFCSAVPAVSDEDTAREILRAARGELNSLCLGGTCRRVKIDEEEPVGKATCGGCGETWPCSDSRRKDISARERAKHTVATAR